MTANLDLHAELCSAALDHAIRIDPVHGLAAQEAGAAKGGAEEGALAIVPETGCLDIFIQKGFELVMRRHFMALAAFFVQPDPPAHAVGKIILDPHGDDGAAPMRAKA